LNPDDGPTEERVEKFIRRGAQIVGGTAGAAIGLIGTPAAALAGGAAGAALGEVLASAGIELYERLLGPRQAARAAGALAVAAVRIEERLEAGEQPRSDFVDESGAHTPDAEEILEGTLLTAANAHEQRKVQYLGNFYANLAFAPRISPGYANLLLKLADRLTYGQMAVMAVVGDADRRNALMRTGAERSEGAFRSSTAIVAELDELGASGVIGVRQDDETVVRPSNVLGTGSYAEIDLVRAALTEAGRDLYDLLGLATLPREDQDAVMAALRGET
jgi:uncharacterized protein YbjQ (UPF0145 family)